MGLVVMACLSVYASTMAPAAQPIKSLSAGACYSLGIW